MFTGLEQPGVFAVLARLKEQQKAEKRTDQQRSADEGYSFQQVLRRREKARCGHGPEQDERAFVIAAQGAAGGQFRLRYGSDLDEAAFGQGALDKVAGIGAGPKLAVGNGEGGLEILADERFIRGGDDQAIRRDEGVQGAFALGVQGGQQVVFEPRYQIGRAGDAFQHGKGPVCPAEARTGGDHGEGFAGFLCGLDHQVGVFGAGLGDDLAGMAASRIDDGDADQAVATQLQGLLGGGQGGIGLLAPLRLSGLQRQPGIAKVAVEPGGSQARGGEQCLAFGVLAGGEAVAELQGGQRHEDDEAKRENEGAKPDPYRHGGGNGGGH